MKKMSDIAGGLLCGAGQVMFIENMLTGALFLAGIAVGSWMNGTPVVALGAVVGLVCATLCGCLLSHSANSNDDCLQGMCGFNGILVGCALPTFFGNSWVMWVALMTLSAVSPLLRLCLDKTIMGLGINSLTFPFIALTWMFFLLPLEAAESHPMNAAIAIPSVVEAWLNGISQVFLVCSPLCGALFLLGLLVANRKAAVWCAAGSAAGIVMALVCGQDTAVIRDGLYGFNPALTAIALGAVFNRGPFITLVAVAATVLVQIVLAWLLAHIGIPGLTAPFCIATWAVLIATKKRG